MAQTKPKYMLIEHDRYFYQRKVPLDFQRSVGRKKWRAPLGSDFDAAYTRLKVIEAEHDALLEKLQCPDGKQEHATKVRRNITDAQYARQAREGAADEKWCHDNGVKTYEEEYTEFVKENDPVDLPVRQEMERWLGAG